MVPDEETELRRLAAMLEQIDKILPDDSPLREGLLKAGYSLSYSFTDGRRRDIEAMYSVQDAELSPHQREHLESLGINPDQDSCPTDETDWRYLVSEWNADARNATSSCAESLFRDVYGYRPNASDRDHQTHAATHERHPYLRREGPPNYLTEARRTVGQQTTWQVAWRKPRFGNVGC